MKFIVYVLKSLIDDARYIGMIKDLLRRVNEHNKGRNRYPKGDLPWEVINREKFSSWSEARIHEKYLKTLAGRKF